MYVLRVLIMLSIDDIARAVPQLTLKELELNRQDWVCVSFYNANTVCLLYQLSSNFWLSTFALLFRLIVTIGGKSLVSKNRTSARPL